MCMYPGLWSGRHYSSYKSKDQEEFEANAGIVIFLFMIACVIGGISAIVLDHNNAKNFKIEQEQAWVNLQTVLAENYTAGGDNVIRQVLGMRFAEDKVRPLLSHVWLSGVTNVSLITERLETIDRVISMMGKNKNVFCSYKENKHLCFN